MSFVANEIIHDMGDSIKKNQLIIALYDKGYTIQEIEEYTKCCHKYIDKVLKRKEHMRKVPYGATYGEKANV